MTTADVALLNNSIAGVGDAFRDRRRERDVNAREMERIALEKQLREQEATRYAQQRSDNQAHVATSEKLAADKFAWEKDPTNPQNAARQDAAEQRAAQQKQALLQAVITLNATGALTDESRNQFNDFLANDPHMSVSGIQLQAPKNPKVEGKGSAMASAVKSAEEYRAKATEAATPEEAQQYTDYAELLENYAKKQGEFAPVKIPPTKIETMTPNNKGVVTNRTTTFQPAMTAPPVPMQSATPKRVNSQAEYDALPDGATYVDSKGTVAVKGGKKK